MYSENRIMQEIYNEDPDVLHVRSTGNFIWKIDGGEINSKNLSSNTFLSKISYLIGELQMYGPVYSRHYDDMPRSELHYRKLALTVVELAAALKNEEISWVVLETGASHHIDSFVLELAARIADIPQIFLEQLILGGRLLPVVQLRNVTDRESFKLPFATSIDISSLVELQSFIAIKFRDDRNLTSFIRAKILVGLHHLYLLIYKWKQILRLFLSNRKIGNRFCVRTQHEPVNQFIEVEDLKGYSLRTEFRLMNTHRDGLRFLSNQIEVDREEVLNLISNSANSKTAPLFVLAAHVQPEAAVFPLGGKFHNQIDICFFLRAKGFHSPIIYKEHPAMKIYSQNFCSTRAGTMCSPSYYQSLADLGCLFVDEHFKLEFEGDFLPITITGSIALERSLRGLHTIVAGHPWYSGMPGCIALEELSSGKDLSYATEKKSDIGFKTKDFLESIISRSTFANHVFPYEKEVEESSKDMFKKDFRSFLNTLKSHNLTE